MKTTSKMNTTTKIKITSNMKITLKWIHLEKWGWFLNWRWPKIENVILKTVPGPSLYDPSRHCFYQFCRTFMKVYDDFILSIHQCSTNNKFCTQYIFEHICKKLQISNIFVTGQLTEYEYRIYSFLATWPNTNIEYIRS